MPFGSGGSGGAPAPLPHAAPTPYRVDPPHTQPSFVRRLPSGVLGAAPTPNVRDVYTLGRVLGRGAFGVTRVAAAKDGSGDAAVKSVPLARLRDAADVEALRREVAILGRLDHEHVVRLRGSFEDSAHVHLVMDLCAGGELFDAITRRGFFSEARPEASRVCGRAAGARAAADAVPPLPPRRAPPSCCASLCPPCTTSTPRASCTGT